MLEIKELSKNYGEITAVRGVNLAIREGEFFSLLGPSGCGKTTLLRMLAGFERPTAGEIYHDGVKSDGLPPHQRPFNMVFQRYALFPHLSVRRNIEFGLRMKHVPAHEIKARVEEALGMVQLDGLAERSISTLSGGQSQRVALARALVNRPKVLLLDEPLSALDLKLRQQMQVELLALQRRLKHTFVFVTHDQEEALTLSDRIAVMRNGVVEQVGSPQDIYEFPQTDFVANFIGQVNTLMGEVKEVTAESIRVATEFRRTIVIRATRDGLRPLPTVKVGAQVRVLVRPEKLKVLKSQVGADQNSIEGILKEVLYLGPFTQFHVEAPSKTVVTIAVPNTAVTSRKTFQLGERVFIAWAPEDALIMTGEI